jgi:hypothetical protein
MHFITGAFIMPKPKKDDVVRVKKQLSMGEIILVHMHVARLRTIHKECVTGKDEDESDISFAKLFDLLLES